MNKLNSIKSPMHPMSLFRHWPTAALILGLVVLTVTGCGQSRPSNTDLVNALNGALPVSMPYTIVGVEPDYFPQAGGTLAIKGKASGKTKDTLYQSVSFADQLKSLGYDQAQWKETIDAVNQMREPYKSALIQQIPRESQGSSYPALVKVATPPGSEVRFDFTATAQKGDSGWLISDVSIASQGSLSGQPLNQFNNALVVDSPEGKAEVEDVFKGRQDFSAAVKKAQDTIVAEDAKLRDSYLAATNAGKIYDGTSTGGSGAPWPLSLCFQQQKTIGNTTVLTGYAFDPANPQHRKNFTGGLNLNPQLSQGHPVQLTLLPNDGIDVSIVRSGNGTDEQMDSRRRLLFDLALDPQGNLTGVDRINGTRLTFAPKP